MRWNGIVSRAMWWMLLSLASCSEPAGGNNDTDRLSLLAFKARIAGDPFDVLSSWNDSSHFCNWVGVGCGNRNKRVVELDLQSYALSGTLSPDIGNLSFLRILNLKNNSLTRNIPDELGRLFRLRKLVLENNSFTGRVPASLSNCSEMQYLDLGGNKLVSGIPPELGSLSQLQTLVFERNELDGGLPSSFGNLSNLEAMWGINNRLSGGIPEEIGNLKSLQVLSLGGNNLEGIVPPSIFNLSNLYLLSFTINQLTGPLPSDIGLTLPRLAFFQIALNHFTGPLPATLSNTSNLVYFEVSQNNFTGRVPVLQNPIKLEHYMIYGNELGNGGDGVDDLEFLYPLSNSTRLRELYINENQIRGVVPQMLSNFSKELQGLSLGSNQLRGSIPAEIGNLINLQVLYLYGNLLTGTIPESIGKLRNLASLYLDRNNLSGSIPYSLGNATSLLDVFLDSNTLEGKIPLSFGNLKWLLYLNCDENHLSGMIPKELLGNLSSAVGLGFAGNQLTGHVPAEIGKLANLNFLELSSNRLSGEIPSSLGSCIVLDILYLDSNFFEGSIPSSLSSMRGLQYVDLSHNNLSGEIPKFLEDLQLLKLDLSFNNLEGEVPSKGVFQNASAFSFARNKKLCGGVLTLNLTRCTARKLSEPRRSSSSAKLKLILSISGGISAPIFVALLIVAYQSWRRKNIKPTEVAPPDVSFPQLSYEDLLKATDGFSTENLIGTGSFGAVYRGVLGDGGQTVAVKVLNLLRRGANRSFIAECEALSNIRHRNLVKVISVCSSIDFQGNDFKALVYEFIANGSLEQWIHPNDESEQPDHPRGKLSLVQRLNIAFDMANVLQYLHRECETPLVHCDLKPSNILMDMDMTAHLVDFGLARFLTVDANPNVPSNSTSSVGVKGTIGYAAPEYGMGSEVSPHGDIYSFGILLLEVFTGKRPSDEMFKEGLTLHNSVKMAIPDRVEEVVDPILLTIDSDHQRVSGRVGPAENARHKVIECLASFLGVGIACSADSPRDRMDIGNVVIELHRLRNSLVGRNLRGRVPIRP